jgi:hypothetical protein
MNPQQANLQSIHVLESTRAAFIRCREEVGLALAETDSEVDRLVTWLQNDRMMYWRGRINRLREDLTSSKESKPSTVDERKALAKVKELLADAERRAVRTKLWALNFPRDQALFKGATALAASMHERELPAAIIALGRMGMAIERYVRDEPLDLSKMLEVELANSETTISMKRGVEDEHKSDSDAKSTPDSQEKSP